MEKEANYQLLAKQVESLLEGEDNTMGQLANAAALIHEAIGAWWTGFYIVHGDELLLGPFQGPVACYRIKRGRGVCGTAWQENRTIVVPDVEQFPGHIACSSLSRSEIVVPLRDLEGIVIAVLDIDSRDLAAFDEADASGLEAVAQAITRHVHFPSFSSDNSESSNPSNPVTL